MAAGVAVGQRQFYCGIDCGFVPQVDVTIQMMKPVDASGWPELRLGEKWCQVVQPRFPVVETLGDQIGFHAILVGVLVECAGGVDDAADVAVTVI